MFVEYVSKDLLTDLSRLQFSKFFNVAALAIFAFDYCLTFPFEVEYVWGTNWEMARIIFTLSRYLPFISASATCYGDVVIREGCRRFVFAVNVMYISSIVSAEGILILRTYALWGRNKGILFFLLSLAAAFIVASQVVSKRFRIVQPGDSASAYQFNSSLCAYQSSRNDVFQYGFLVAYELILQGMSSWRKFRTYRGLRSRMLDTLYWDGIAYMWWIIVLSGCNMIASATAPIPYIPSLDTAQVVIHSVLASRIFFSLRACDKQIRAFGDATSLGTMRYRARSTVDATTQSSTQIEAVHVA